MRLSDVANDYVYKKNFFELESIRIRFKIKPIPQKEAIRNRLAFDRFKNTHEHKKIVDNVKAKSHPRRYE